MATGLPIRQHDGDSLSDEFGDAVAGVGDVNGDGVNDYAIGAYLDDNNGNGSGMVRVFSGSSGVMLYQWDGAAATDAFGYSLSYLGDVNGDGRADVLVGARQKQGGASTVPGYASVYSGATGAVLYTVSGLAANDQFGYDVTGGYDVDGDGVNDFAVGIYGEDTNGSNAGSVNVYSGATGTLLYSLYGDNKLDHFGNALSLVGDLDGDGFADLVVGAVNDDNNGTDSGMVRIFSGNTGTVLGQVDGLAAGDGLGYSVSDFADTNGDGKPEFLAGAWRVDGAAGADTGAVYLIDGASFAILQSPEGGLASDRLGFSCAGLGDVNGDGLPDYVGGGSEYGGPGASGNGVTVVYDPTGTPPPPPVRWPNLPSTFVSIGTGYTENFDGLGGVVPPEMAVNMLNSLSRAADPDAYCNIGQLGPTSGGASGIGPHTAPYALEMGGVDPMSNNHDVSNALIIGLDGTGAGNLTLNFWGIDHGDEVTTDDGVWVSDDGVTWYAAVANWSGLTTGTWTQTTGVDISGVGANTNGPFYLAFSQQDNFPFANGDGVSIDEIEVVPAGAGGPTLSVSNVIGGQLGTITVINNNPGDLVIVGYSLLGGGPINTTYGQVFMTPPFTQLPPMTADASGVASITLPVPSAGTGHHIWMQGLNQTQGVLTNPLDFIIG